MSKDEAEAALQMVRFRLLSLHLEFDDTWLDREQEAPDEYTPKARGRWYVVDEEKGRYRAELSLKLRPKEGTSARFRRVDAAVAGIFVLAPDLEEGLSHGLLVFSAPAMLHGMIRGIIAQATGLCLGGPVLVPAVNYQELFRSHLRTAKRLTAASEKG